MTRDKRICLFIFLSLLILFPVYHDTCHAIELNIRANVPEWQGQEVRIALEQDATFTPKGIFYLDSRQTWFHLIK